MTRRERLERKLEKRAEWAEKADQRSTQRFNTARQATDGIPFGQPILVGHHSEKRHRRAIDRMASNMTKGCEEADLAKHHREKADGLERQLDRSIFSDDPDAKERLEEKGEQLTAKADQMVAANKHFRKHKTMRGFPGLTDEGADRIDQRIARLESWQRKQPFASYEITNLRARARQASERLKAVQALADRTAKAEAAPGGILIAKHDAANWCTVTFAEKPAREIIEALKTAGYRWGEGSWHGYLAQLPSTVLDLEREARLEANERELERKVREYLTEHPEATLGDVTRALETPEYEQFYTQYLTAIRRVWDTIQAEQIGCSTCGKPAHGSGERCPQKAIMDAANDD